MTPYDGFGAPIHDRTPCTVCDGDDGDDARLCTDCLDDLADSEAELMAEMRRDERE